VWFSISNLRQISEVEPSNLIIFRENELFTRTYAQPVQAAACRIFRNISPESFVQSDIFGAFWQILATIWGQQQILLVIKKKKRFTSVNSMELFNTRRDGQKRYKFSDK
jgi:hypothetical protein